MSTSHLNTLFIGIAGGSASGKTTVVKKVMASLKTSEVALLDLDSYYKSFSELSDLERTKINFDHPDSFDVDLLLSHIAELRTGNSIKKPTYDFSRNTRGDNTTTILPSPIIIIEGILIFAIPKLREIFDMKIFVDAPKDVCLMRRIKRDILERGRTLESVEKQYFNVVRPMYLQFIEPTIYYADIIIPRGGKNTVAINMLVSRIKALIQEKKAL
ncbi:MAG: uridine kinase [Fusobacteria bacterium]|nr:uridine kinase [Fusobacteriota bacterium]